jgi:hypothetical protein
MRIIDVEQNTDEWLQERKGKILGSRVYSVLASKTGTKDQIIDALDKFGIDYPKTSPKKESDQVKPKGVKEDFEKLLTIEAQAYLMTQAEKKLEFYQLIADHIAIDTKYEYDDNDEIVFNAQSMMDRGHSLEDEAADIFAKRTGKSLEKVGICVRDDDDNIGQSPDRLIMSDRGVYNEALEVKCLKSSKHLQAFIEKTIPDEYFSQGVQYFVVNEDLETLYFAFYDPRIPYECGFHWIEMKRTDPEISKRIPQYLAYERLLLAEVQQWVERLTF